MKRTWLQRLSMASTPDLAESEVRAFVAAGRSPGDPHARVRAIYEKHRVQTTRRTEIGLRIYEAACAEFLDDKELSPDEARQLDWIADVLELEGQSTREVLVRRAYPAFRNACLRAVRNSVVTEEEQGQLDRLGATLGLDAGEMREIFRQVAKETVEEALEVAVSDERLSPQEMQAVQRIARGLGFELKHSPGTQALLDRFSLLWQVEQGQMPVLQSDVPLTKNEVLHAQSQAEWHEERRVTQRVDYHGVAISIPIMRGVRYRLGSVRPAPVRRDVLTLIDSGVLYVTNKRLLFVGAKGGKTIRYSGLVSVDVLADGMRLNRATGKHPYLVLDGDLDLIATIVSEALGRS